MDSSKLLALPAARVVTGGPEDEDLWDVARAAQYLGLSRHWVYKAVASGTIPYRKIGAAVRFVPAEIKAWALGERNTPVKGCSRR
jgi:excisionase family DNA binding protein